VSVKISFILYFLSGSVFSKKIVWCNAVCCLFYVGGNSDYGTLSSFFYSRCFVVFYFVAINFGGGIVSEFFFMAIVLVIMEKNFLLFFLCMFGVCFCV
jgi:hypothetical protein